MKALHKIKEMFEWQKKVLKFAHQYPTEYNAKFEEFLEIINQEEKENEQPLIPGSGASLHEQHES